MRIRIRQRKTGAANAAGKVRIRVVPPAGSAPTVRRTAVRRPAGVLPARRGR